MGCNGYAETCTSTTPMCFMAYTATSAVLKQGKILYCCNYKSYSLRMYHSPSSVKNVELVYNAMKGTV